MSPGPTYEDLIQKVKDLEKAFDERKHAEDALVKVKNDIAPS